MHLTSRLAAGGVRLPSQPLAARRLQAESSRHETGKVRMISAESFAVVVSHCTLKSLLIRPGSYGK